MAARKARTSTSTPETLLYEPLQPSEDGVTARPFSRVYSASIKGGVDVKLGPCTAIVGANRAGKTAVLDAIRLALTGKHPVGPHYADLLALTSGKAPDAHLIGPDAEAHASVAGGHKSVDLAHTGALAALSEAQKAAILPLTSVRDLLALGNDRAREAIFARFGNTTDIPVPPGLDEEQTALWSLLVKQAEGADAATRLSAMGSLLRSHKLACGKVAKSHEDEAEQYRAIGSAVPPTADQLAALEKQHEAATAFEQSATIRQQLAQVQAALDAHRLTPVAAPPPPVDVSDLPALNSALAIVDGELEAYQRQLGAAKVIGKLREKVATGAHTSCGVCLQPVSPAAAAGVGSAPSLEGALLDEIARRQARRSGVVNSRAALLDLHQRTQAAIQANQMQRQMWESQARAMESQVHTLTSALGNVTDPGVTAQQASAAVREARGARDAAEKVNSALLHARKARREADNCKVLEKAASSLLAQLVAGVAAQAEAAVRKYLPEVPGGFAARLALEDAEGKPACRWEVRGSDTTYHPFGAASGAEWGALTVALGCAWTEGAPVRILLLDDADLAPLSPSNVRALLNSVQARVDAGDLTQAIVAWCRPDEVPAGWTVVQR